MNFHNMLFAYAYFTNAMMQFWKIKARVALQVNWALMVGFKKIFFLPLHFLMSHDCSCLSCMSVEIMELENWR